MTKVLELYGLATDQQVNWRAVVEEQRCPFLDRKCQKNRKSEPEVTIGTCTVARGVESQPVIICPFRLLERG
jgi:hypothetical protein